MIRRETQTFINIGALALVLLFNYLSNVLPFNNLTQRDLSLIYPVLITPAPYVFSIWALIYLSLIAFSVYQALPGYREHPLLKAVGLLFAASCLFNILWLFAWHYQQVGWSMIIMLFLLLTLITIYLRINAIESEKSIYAFLLVRFPFSLYLGWISVASIANLNVLLFDLGWLGVETGGVIFTMLMIIIAAIIALTVFTMKRDFIYVFVFIWAFIGIGARHGTDVIMITLTAWLAAAAILFFLGWITANKKTMPWIPQK